MGIILQAADIARQNQESNTDIYGRKREPFHNPRAWSQNDGRQFSLEA